MTRMTFFVLLAFVVLIAFVGCASIMHGSKQSIAFASQPSEATVEVFTYDVSEGSCETPCTLKLRRKHDYKVVFSKQGYDSIELQIHRGTDGWVWGNLLFGGIIGLIIDYSSGSAYKLKPDHLSATLSKSAFGSLPKLRENEVIGIFDISSLSVEEQAKVRQLEKVNLRDLL